MHRRVLLGALLGVLRVCACACAGSAHVLLDMRCARMESACFSVHAPQRTGTCSLARVPRCASWLRVPGRRACVRSACASGYDM